MDKNKFVKQLFGGCVQKQVKAKVPDPESREKEELPEYRPVPVSSNKYLAKLTFAHLDETYMSPKKQQIEVDDPNSLKRADTNDFKRLLSQLEYGLDKSQTPIASQIKKPQNFFARKDADEEELNDLDQDEIEKMLRVEDERLAIINQNYSYQHANQQNGGRYHYNHFTDNSNANMGLQNDDENFRSRRLSFGEFNQGFNHPQNGNPNESNGIVFTTAGGGAINLSKDQLAKAAKLLQGDDDEDEEELADKMPVDGGFSNGFSNGFNKPGNFSTGPTSFPPAFKNPTSSSSFNQNHNHNHQLEKDNGQESFGFGNPMNNSSSGPISFSTGGMKQIKINDEDMKKAMALFKDSDDEEGEKPIPVPENPFKGQSVKPTGNTHVQKPNMTLKHQGKRIFPSDPSEEKSDSINSLQGDPKEATLKEETVEIKPNGKPSAFQKQEPVQRKLDKKKAFGVPYKINGGFGSLKSGAIVLGRNPVRPKVRESKLNNKIFIDQDRFKRMTIRLHKPEKLTNLKGNRLVEKNYGVRFLPIEDLFDHLKKEMASLSINSSDELIEELTLEMQVQIGPQEVSSEWVKHHLHMLSRKYHDRVRLEGPFGSTYPSLSPPCIISYPVTMSNILTDLYYRCKREGYFESKSYLRRVIESNNPFNNMRLCLLVCNIIKEESKYVIEMTDGWYIVYTSIHCGPDQENLLMSNKDNFGDFEKFLILRLVIQGKLKIGDKIEVTNLEIESGDRQGQNSNKSGERERNRDKEKPNEMKDGNYRVEVKLQYNAMKRLPKETKLGMLYTKLKPMRMNTVKSRGGLIPLIDVIIVEKKGVKLIREKCVDEYMIKMREEEMTDMAFAFGITVVDALHLDPEYKEPQTYHHFTFSGASPGVYTALEIGQRVRIYGARIKKKILDRLQQANYGLMYRRGLTLYINKKHENNIDLVKIPHANKERVSAVLGPWKKFSPIDVIKDRIIEAERNFQIGIQPAEGLITSLALRFVKHNDKFCLFHFYERHFVQLEIAYDQPVAKEKDAPAETFWQRTVKHLSSLTEANSELLVFSDIQLKPNPKVIQLVSRGDITLHKFVFDSLSNFIVGENFVLSNCGSNSLEHFLISEYKSKYKSVKLSEDDTIGKLIQAMAKIHLQDN